MHLHHFFASLDSESWARIARKLASIFRSESWS